jgi:hypothetical protein
MRRSHGWARAVSARLSPGQARTKPAIVALARQLLVRCWALRRAGAAWREGPEPPAAPAGAAGPGSAGRARRVVSQAAPRATDPRGPAASARRLVEPK